MGARIGLSLPPFVCFFDLFYTFPSVRLRSLLRLDSPASACVLRLRRSSRVWKWSEWVRRDFLLFELRLFRHFADPRCSLLARGVDSFTRVSVPAIRSEFDSPLPGRWLDRDMMQPGIFVASFCPYLLDNCPSATCPLLLVVTFLVDSNGKWELGLNFLLKWFVSYNCISFLLILFLANTRIALARCISNLLAFLVVELSVSRSKFWLGDALVWVISRLTVVHSRNGLVYSLIKSSCSRATRVPENMLVIDMFLILRLEWSMCGLISLTSVAGFE